MNASPIRRRRAVEFVRYSAVVMLALALAVPLMARAAPDALPAGSRLQFRIREMLSSDKSQTGQSFTFQLTAPVKSSTGFAVPEGSIGSGTVYLAGHAGSAGHEGDLTLRLDSLRAPDGKFFNFDDQRFEINGKNRKIASAVLGFVPFVGIASRWAVRGEEVSVDPSTPVETVLERPAVLSSAAAVPAPPPDMATPSPAPAPTLVPTPVPSTPPS